MQDHKMLRNVELRKLPAGTLSVIIDILEIDNDWKKVMSLIPKDPNGDRQEPKYNIEDIRIVEEYARATKQKCAEILFDEWGTSGRARPTLVALRDVAVAAGAYRAVDEIAALLQEAAPARPRGGPEQQITTAVTKLLEQSMQQQISTAQANDYSNKNEYQEQCTEPMQSVYYGVQSVNTADLPNIFALQPPQSANMAATHVASVSDFMKFTTELSQSESTDACEQNYLRESIKPSSNICLDSVISQDTNLMHFRYSELEILTNYFSESPPDMIRSKKAGKIGSGGFGDVFLGYHGELGALAIKRASQHQLRHYEPDVVSRVFNSEVKYLSKFRHENIVPILGYSIDGPSPCIICEYISEGSLLQKIADKVLNESQRINIMLGAAEGLKYLHTSKLSECWGLRTQPDMHITPNNFMHGDVKSANILLTGDYEPKLCDFGLAKQYEATCEVSSPMGTSAYMAPEGLSGTITQKLDVYSYGIVLLELLTGLNPIVQQNGDQINIKVYVEENCYDNNISKLLDQSALWTRAEDIFTLAQRCLKHERNNRPSMTTICDILHVIQDN